MSAAADAFGRLLTSAKPRHGQAPGQKCARCGGGDGASGKTGQGQADAGLHSCSRGMRFIYANPVESLAWVLNDEVMKGVCIAKDNGALLAFMKIVLRGGVRQARPVRSHQS